MWCYRNYRLSHIFNHISRLGVNSNNEIDIFIENIDWKMYAIICNDQFSIFKIQMLYFHGLKYKIACNSLEKGCANSCSNVNIKWWIHHITFYKTCEDEIAFTWWKNMVAIHLVVIWWKSLWFFWTTNRDVELAIALAWWQSQKEQSAHTKNFTKHVLIFHS